MHKFFRLLIFILFFAFLLFFSIKNSFATEYPNYEWSINIGSTSSTFGNVKAKVDSSGNIYLTGYFANTVDFDPTDNVDQRTSINNSNDVFLTRINTDKTYGWTRNWGGTGSDTTVDIFVDSTGNIYVLGMVSGTVDFDPGDGVDNHSGSFVTKYDSSGNYQWTQTIIGTPKSIAVDDSNNFYVTGVFKGTLDFNPDPGVSDNFSSNDSYFYDIFVTRFNNDRTYGWTRTFGGNRDDNVNKIIIISNSIYLTGSVRSAAGVQIDLDPTSGTYYYTPNGTSGYNDAFLSKLNSDGSFGWARAFGDYYLEEGVSIAADSNGYIYLTGWYTYNPDFDPSSGVDQILNTYEMDTNIFLSKYDNNGNYYWTKAFGGGDNDKSNDIAVDNDGNIYITGSFELGVDFDVGEGIDIHYSNASSDFFVTRYNSDGSYGWTVSFGGDKADSPSSVSVLADKTIYVVGKYTGDIDFDFTEEVDVHLGSATNAFAAKYSQSSDGWNPGPITLPTKSADMEFSFGKSFGGEEEENIYGAFDRNGNLFITGMTYSSTVDYDPSEGEDVKSLIGWQDTYLSKYNADGSYAWTITFGGSDAAVWPGAIAVDSQGNVYIGGGFWDGAIDFDPTTEGTNWITPPNETDQEAFVSKFDNNGNYIWTRTFGGLEWDNVFSLTIDRNDNLYFSGTMGWEPVDFDFTIEGTDIRYSVNSYDAFVSKWNADGSYGWTRTMGSESDEEGLEIAVDSSGSVYVVGTFYPPLYIDPTGINYTLNGINSLSDVYLVKFDSNGNFRWAKAIGGENWDYGSSVTVDSSDNIYVAGSIDGTNGFVDLDPSEGEDLVFTNLTEEAFVSKYDSDGNYLGTKMVSAGEGDDFVSDIITDSENNLYVIGGFSGKHDFDPTSNEDVHISNGNTDNFLSKYYADGSYGWTYTFGSISLDNEDTEFISGTERYNSNLAFYGDSLYVFGSHNNYVDLDPSQGITLTSIKKGVLFQNLYH